MYKSDLKKSKQVLKFIEYLFLIKEHVLKNILIVEAFPHPFLRCLWTTCYSSLPMSSTYYCAGRIGSCFLLHLCYLHEQVAGPRKGKHHVLSKEAGRKERNLESEFYIVVKQGLFRREGIISEMHKVSLVKHSQIRKALAINTNGKVDNYDSYYWLIFSWICIICIIFSIIVKNLSSLL